MAQVTAQDPHSGLPEAAAARARLARTGFARRPARAVSVDEKIQIALDTEKRALAFDPRITNSEGAEFSNQFGRVIYANSQGFAGEYSRLDFRPFGRAGGIARRCPCNATIGIRPIANSASLESPKSVGERAAQRVLRRLGARKVKTCEVPIVFDPEMAASLLRNLSSAISGYCFIQGRVVFGRQTRHANRLRAADGDRRRHDPRRPRLATVRRRRTCRCDKKTVVEKGRAAKLFARYLQRQKARHGIHRQRVSLGRRSARAFRRRISIWRPASDSPEQMIKSVKAGFVRHRDDRLRRQHGHRRLLARRRRFVDRERRVRLIRSKKSPSPAT